MAATTAIEVRSPAFEAGGTLPTAYTCEGPGNSPEIAWDPGPVGTETFAVLLEDPDAPGGVFTHWLVYDIPPGINVVKEGAGDGAHVPDGASAGLNDFGKTGFGAPCPPRDSPEHRYHFRVYALDARLELPPGAQRPDFDREIEGHVLAQGELVARFGR